MSQSASSVDRLKKFGSWVDVGELRNVFLSIQQARVLGKEDFARKCLEYVDQNAANLIQSTNFLQIDQQLLCEILDRDQLMINEELTIWNAVLRWANEKCRQNGKECSTEHRREVLGPALFKIRFPLIPFGDLANKIIPSCVLTADEEMSVLMNVIHKDGELPERYPLKFPTHPRGQAHTILLQGKLLADYEVITLKIEKVSEFARENENSRRLSEAVYIRGLPWQILATFVDVGQIYLGFYLQCNKEDGDANWSCAAAAKLKVISQMEGKNDFTRPIVKKFYHTQKKIWGYYQFMSLKALIDRNNGWYDAKNDTVILNAEVTAKEPIGVE